MKKIWQSAWWAAAAMLALVSAFVWVPGGYAQQSAHKDVKAATPGAAEKGGQCIRETSFMRKNHMNLILHKRDQTMHKGIRTRDASLAECVTCHAKKDDRGQFMTTKNPKHFCRGCHDKVAVAIDCFECHASRPVPEETGDKASLSTRNGMLASHGMKSAGQSVTALTNYLGGRQ